MAKVVYVDYRKFETCREVQKEKYYLMYENYHLMPNFICKFLYLLSSA